MAEQDFGSLAAYLNTIGLNSLFSIDAAGNPSGWLWNRLQAGIDPDSLLIELQATDEFRDRFAIILDQQQRAAAGEPVYVMTPSEVIDYERDVSRRMAQAGLPSGFYDQPEDFHELMRRDMSPAEVGDRITEAFEYVKAAPPEVRDAFDQFYGVGNGDAALAAWALDSERTVRDIKQATRSAYTAGMATRFDIQIDQAAAERIAQLPRTEAGITEGLRQAAQLTGVATEGAFEANDLTSQDLLSSVFEGDAEATRLIENRIISRRRHNTAGTGGAIVTREGVVGAGSS